MNREGYLQMTRLQWHSSQNGPTITVHAGKHYKALLDLKAAISLMCYSTYQSTDSSFKTPIQATTTKMNTADGSSMTALGITAFHLRTVDFKFTHNFIICDRLPDTEILFRIDIQKKCPCRMPGIRKRTAIYRRMADFSLILETVTEGNYRKCQVNSQNTT